MYSQNPFASWVPKPVMLLLILLILLPMMAISGVYTSVSSDVSGALAIYPEYVSIANNANVIGMSSAFLIVLRTKFRFRSKEIVAGGATILAILSYICGTVENPLIIILCSLLIGFVKFFVMIEMMLPLMFVVSPTGERGKFYAVYYPIALCLTQWIGYYASHLVTVGSPQSPYYMMSAVMIVIAILSLIFQHNLRFGFKMPLYQIDWFSLLLLISSAMFFNYGFVFMKQQSWFVSPYITGSLLTGTVLFILFYFRQKHLKRPLLDFSAFKKPNVRHAALLLMFLGIYLASASIFMQYAVGVLGYTNLIISEINLWMIPGIVIAGILAFFGFKNKWPLKYYIMLGFTAMFVHVLLLYFLIQPQMDIRYLEYTMAVKGLGMGILFIGVWFYASLNLELNQMFGMMALLNMLRSFISTAIGGALISWATYKAQWQAMSDLSMSIDAADALKNTTAYQTVYSSALMDSGKIVLGTLCWLIIPVLAIIIAHSYGSFNFRRIIIFRKAIRGNSVKGYHLS